MTLCQPWNCFCMLRKLWKTPSRKTRQKFIRNLQGKYLWRSFVIVKVFFFTVHSNFTYDSEAYDLIWNFTLRIYFRFWTPFHLNCTHRILISVSPNFLDFNHLINFSGCNFLRIIEHVQQNMFRTWSSVMMWVNDSQSVSRWESGWWVGGWVCSSRWAS